MNRRQFFAALGISTATFALMHAFPGAAEIDGGSQPCRTATYHYRVISHIAIFTQEFR